MSFFERWFGGKDSDIAEPDIRFGRYSDSYKDPSCYDAWDKALILFEDEKYLEAYEQFLYFLRDEAEDNVHWDLTPNGLSFELYQGSKRVIGWATRMRLRVEARVAHIMDSRPELLRRLVEQNYSLKFSRYALDPDQHIVVIFETETADASPYKLYYALKEVATQADKQDDLLLEEFGQLEPVDSSHLRPLPPVETQAKHSFILSSIQSVLQEVRQGTLDGKKYPGGVAYLLLDLIYRLDYLTKPEGYTMETLEGAHRRFFTKDSGLTDHEKNERLIAELEKLLERSRQDYREEMYRVQTTFGITSPVTHDRVVGLIDSELSQMEWYQTNGHEPIAAAIPGYIVGYSLFNYAIPQPDRDFFHLYYRVTEPTYFKALGFTNTYSNGEGNQVDRRAVKRAIEGIVRKYRHRYPQLRPAVSKLVFGQPLDFARSYLMMIRELDLTRMD